MHDEIKQKKKKKKKQAKGSKTKRKGSKRKKTSKRILFWATNKNMGADKQYMQHPQKKKTLTRKGQSGWHD